MFRLMIISNVIVVGLLSSPNILGMKRKTNDKQLQLKSNLSPQMIEKDLDKLYELSMPDMNIVNVLDETLQQLPIQQRLFELRSTHQKRRAVIDFYQQQRQGLLLALPSDHALMRLEIEEENMRWRFVDNRNNAQEELRKSFNIDKKSPTWVMRTALLKERGVFNVKSLKEPCDTATWCINTPVNFAYTLMAKMKEKGLNPSAVDVKPVPAEKNNKYYTIIAECRSAQSIMNHIQNENNLIINFQKNKPAYIGYNPAVVNQDIIFVEQLITHELNHLLEKDNELNEGIIENIAYCAQVNANDVEKHPAYTKLRLSEETYADAALSLTNHTKAAAVMKMDSLYSESYKALAFLKMNNEVRAEIALRK